MLWNIRVLDTKMVILWIYGHSDDMRPHLLVWVDLQVRRRRSWSKGCSHLPARDCLNQSGGLHILGRELCISCLQISTQWLERFHQTGWGGHVSDAIWPKCPKRRTIVGIFYTVFSTCADGLLWLE